MEKVVVIEDEKHMVDMLRYLFEKNNFSVEDYSSAEEFLMTKRDPTAHCVYLIDSKLPGIQGPEVVKTIRFRDKISPVFIISGQQEDEDISYGLFAGADDYVTKPFHPEHLVVKAQNALRKSSSLAQEINSQGFRLLPEANAFIRDGVTVNLTNREYKILENLSRSPNSTLTRDELLAGFDDLDINARNIDVHIFSLRKKIQKAGIGVETVRGQGYRLAL
jgi:DNA-binding response OmpR family regulator